MSHSSKRFQDGHEVLQHYVKGYEVPEADDGSVEAQIESRKGNRVSRSKLIERVSKLLTRSEKSNRLQANKRSRHR